ncbi:MAG TPA: pseudouridine synthase [Rhodocyclaceae bacterium]|nr:pseudouridine synthase [Rhodocyclaceae bacterium]
MSEEKKRTLRIAPRPAKPAKAVTEKATSGRAQPRYDRARPQRQIPSAPVVAESDDRVRVSKLMAERGLCSRREADSYIERGLVFVNGERIFELGSKTEPDAEIRLDNLAQAQQAARVTIILHKPIGFVSGQAEDGHKPAATLIKAETQQRKSGAKVFHSSNLRGLAPAGRLDIDSTGLLVLTQDGVIARKLIGDDSDVEKEYLVRVEGTLTNEGLRNLNHGLSLDGVELRPAKVNWINDDQLHFVLKEGRKRQIRRMCELVGLKVIGLKRVRIGNVKLGDLPLGQWRFLRDDESF